MNVENDLPTSTVTETPWSDAAVMSSGRSALLFCYPQHFYLKKKLNVHIGMPKLLTVFLLIQLAQFQILWIRINSSFFQSHISLFLVN